MPLILGTNSIKDTGYDVANSVRLNRGDSANFTRTPSSASNRRTWTWSGWVKRSGLGNIQTLFDGSDGGYPEIFYFDADDKFLYHHDISGSDYKLISSQVFRDVSAWMHIVVAKDTTQSTETNRLKVYVNGSQITMNESALGYPTQNFEGAININDLHIIGNWKTNSYYVDGYLCEVAFIDGSQLDATSFGEFDEDSPTIWKPKDFKDDVTFGTNGFYLDFEDSSALGNDVSGNNNDYTPNNLAAIDSCTDTCTNNFAVPNILLQGIDITYTQNNLQIAIGTTGQYGTQSSIGVNAGRWYCELKYIATTSAGNDRVMPGIVGNPNKLATYGVAAGGAPNQGSGYIGGGNDTTSWGYYKDGNIYNNEGTTSYGDTWTLNDIIGIYLDCEDNKLYFSKNGVVQASGTGVSITDPASTVSGNYFFGFTDTSSYGGTVQVNFGGATCYSISSSVSDDNGYGNFEYSPNITGDGSAKKFYSLNSKNLAEFG